MSLGDMDRDWLPEPKSKKFFRKAFRVVKSSIGVAQMFKERIENRNKAKNFHSAQKRAMEFKEWQYLNSLEAKRIKGFTYHENGLKLRDFVWQDKEKRVIDNEKELKAIK